MLDAVLPGGPALVRDFGPGHRDHRHQVTQASEIVGVRRVQRQLGRERRGGDHEVDRSAAGLRACRDHRCRHPPVGTGSVRVKGDRVELVLSPLQHIQPASPLGSLEVDVLLGVRPHLMRSGGKLGERDGADRHFMQCSTGCYSVLQPIGPVLARRGRARELVIGTSVGHDVADRVPDQGAEFGAGDVVERVPGHEQPAEHRAQ